MRTLWTKNTWQLRTWSFTAIPARSPSRSIAARYCNVGSLEGRSWKADERLSQSFNTISTYSHVFGLCMNGQRRTTGCPSGFWTKRHTKAARASRHLKASTTWGDAQYTKISCTLGVAGTALQVRSCQHLSIPLSPHHCAEQHRRANKPMLQ